MKRALEMFVIEGIKTSIPLHRRILADPDFAAGKFDTHSSKDCSERTENKTLKRLVSTAAVCDIRPALLPFPKQSAPKNSLLAGVRLLQYRNKRGVGAESCSSPQRGLFNLDPPGCHLLW